MRKDYHMHPTIIQDPARFAQFARVALENGVEEICVTDHMPLSVSKAGDRIPAGRVADYCQAVRRIAGQYAGRLSVRLGIEIDYHPAFTEEIEAVLKAGAYDFVIGSTHLHVGPGDVFSHIQTRNDFARAALENTILAARSGYFHAIGHLDMFRWIFSLPQRFPLRDDGYSPDLHESLIEKALDAIGEAGLYLEINPHLAVLDGNIESAYPAASIVERALEKNLRFSYGSDAHAPEHVGALLPALEAHPVYGRALARWEAEK